jgi:hypothetical protein
MARKSPSAESLKLLYVRSGNECAFPNCNHPIFNDAGLYVAELCHIKAANIGGPRFDENQTDEDRRSHNNLLFLCHRHHKETDSLCNKELLEIKSVHESIFTEFGKELSREMSEQVIVESHYYWNSQANKTFDLPDLKIARDFNSGIFDLIIELESRIGKIKNYCDLCVNSDSREVLNGDLEKIFVKLKLDFDRVKEIPYYKNPFENRNWEMHNLGNPNLFSHISLCLNQLKVKITEQLTANDPNNLELRKLLTEFRETFEKDFDDSYYFD